MRTKVQIILLALLVGWFIQAYLFVFGVLEVETSGQQLLMASIGFVQLLLIVVALANTDEIVDFIKVKS